MIDIGVIVAAVVGIWGAWYSMREQQKAAVNAKANRSYERLYPVAKAEKDKSTGSVITRNVLIAFALGLFLGN